jgi:predicted neuraminidase
LIYNRSNKVLGQHGIYVRITANPDAEVPIWDNEFRVVIKTPFCFRMNKPIVLSTSAWVMPVTHASQTTHDWFAGPLQRQGVAISRDEGKSWTLFGAVEAPHWALENMVVDCRDGSLLMYIRTGAGVLWQSRSIDKGQTWTEGTPTTITNPGSRFFIHKFSDGDWLLINSPDPAKRTGIVAAVSTDEGETWQGHLVLDDRDNVSYPDAAIAEDGTIYAVHDRDRSGEGEILLSVFQKEDID